MRQRRPDADHCKISREHDAQCEGQRDDAAPDHWQVYRQIVRHDDSLSNEPQSADIVVRRRADRGR